MPGECGIDQGQSADAPEIHQQDENALRQDSKLRRQPQRQAHRTGGGRCFIETGTEGKLLRCADDRRPRKGQPQIQQQNGGGVADGGSSRLRKAAMALAIRTASVVTFMPPAVEPGAPPVSISKMVTA